MFKWTLSSSLPRGCRRWRWTTPRMASAWGKMWRWRRRLGVMLGGGGKKVWKNVGERWERMGNTVDVFWVGTIVLSSLYLLLGTSWMLCVWGRAQGLRLSSWVFMDQLEKWKGSIFLFQSCKAIAVAMESDLEVTFQQGKILEQAFHCTFKVTRYLVRWSGKGLHPPLSPPGTKAWISREATLPPLHLRLHVVALVDGGRAATAGVRKGWTAARRQRGAWVEGGGMVGWGV